MKKYLLTFLLLLPFIGNAYTTNFTYYSPTINPADNTTYYTGHQFTKTPVTTGGVQRVYIFKAGTISSIKGNFHVSTILGSAGSTTVNLRLNNTSDTLITSNAVMTALDNYYSNNSLSIPVVAGDYFEIKWTTPAWATNPTGVLHEGNVFITEEETAPTNATTTVDIQLTALAEQSRGLIILLGFFFFFMIFSGTINLFRKRK